MSDMAFVHIRIEPWFMCRSQSCRLRLIASMNLLVDKLLMRWWEIIEWLKTFSL